MTQQEFMNQIEAARKATFIKARRKNGEEYYKRMSATDFVKALNLPHLLPSHIRYHYLTKGKTRLGFELAVKLASFFNLPICFNSDDTNKDV